MAVSAEGSVELALLTRAPPPDIKQPRKGPGRNRESGEKE